MTSPSGQCSHTSQRIIDRRRHSTICRNYRSKAYFGTSEIAIGELSRQTECNIETIRYYERIALLPQPRRDSRFRRYDSEDVARLRIMRRARQLGFTLDEVRAFLRLAEPRGRLPTLKRAALPTIQKS